ncbi:MAG: hypothetical protein H7841_12530 [Magnetospirillum sp. WYHS-4]
MGLRDAPATVRIFYKQGHHSHIFTSPDLTGLHVGDPSMRKAYDWIGTAVSALVEAMCGVKARYEPDHQFEQVKELVENSRKDNVLLTTVMLATLRGVDDDHGHPAAATGGQGARRAGRRK